MAREGRRVHYFFSAIKQARVKAEWNDVKWRERAGEFINSLALSNTGKRCSWEAE
jgi:hypothetical protein